MTDVVQELRRSKCAPCEGGVAPLTETQIQPMLKGLQGWALEGGMITKTYRFRNYYETMAFVNATAWISHREDHHPDILVGYNQCKVSYITHAIKGLSTNDFICAAKLDALFDL
jgi:4a-hydroxytetrahydrobiopterin dehydratase